jgi:hypothetical protein
MTATWVAAACRCGYKSVILVVTLRGQDEQPIQNATSFTAVVPMTQILLKIVLINWQLG